MVGSQRWYVDWSIEKVRYDVYNNCYKFHHVLGFTYYIALSTFEQCVKDCKDSDSDDCGGYAKSWVDLYDGASDCCNRLWWKERSECTK